MSGRRYVQTHQGESTVDLVLRDTVIDDNSETDGLERLEHGIADFLSARTVKEVCKIDDGNVSGHPLHN
jgi:hypothetical protein